MILVGVIVAALAVGGFLLYSAGQNSMPEIILEDSGVELVDHSENFEGVEAIAPYDPLVEAGEVEDCLTVDSPIAGSTVTFPLEITGTIEYGCWGIFEGEAGFSHIEQNSEVVFHAGYPVDRIINVDGGFYNPSNYPVSFTSVISSVGGVAGPATLILTEKATEKDLEPGEVEILDQVSVAINIEPNLITRDDWGISFEKGEWWLVDANTENQIVLQEIAAIADTITIDYVSGQSVIDSDPSFGDVRYFYDENNEMWMREGNISNEGYELGTVPAVSVGYTSDSMPIFTGTGRWLTRIIPLSHNEFLVFNIIGTGNIQALQDLIDTI